MASRHRGDFTRGYYSISHGRKGYQSTAQTLKALREIGEHAVNAAKMALKEGVDELVEDAKHRAPRRTGKLQESIKPISRMNGAEHEIQANEPAVNKRGIPYGQFVEFDPRIGGKPEGTFLYPAMEKHRPIIRDKIKEAIRGACGG